MWALSDYQDARQNCRRLSVCIYYSIATNFHIWITLIKLLPTFEYELCLITKVAAKIAAKCPTWSIYHKMSSTFHIWTTFIKLLFMSEYGFCLMNENRDCRQNGYTDARVFVLQIRVLCAFSMRCTHVRFKER